MKVTVVSGEVEGSLSTPCSKSYAQRAFAAALLAEGRSTIRGLELCDDTRSAIEAITALGAKVEWVDEHTCTIDGGLSPQSDTINTGESGLAYLKHLGCRFLRPGKKGEIIPENDLSGEE